MVWPQPLRPGPVKQNLAKTPAPMYAAEIGAEARLVSGTLQKTKRPTSYGEEGSNLERRKPSTGQKLHPWGVPVLGASAGAEVRFRAEPCRSLLSCSAVSSPYRRVYSVITIHKFTSSTSSSSSVSLVGSVMGTSAQGQVK